jgi:hypothetical protein
MEHIIGKRIRVKVYNRDHMGKITKDKGWVHGKCEFIGPNLMLDWPLQVTIDRTPYTVDHITDIEII